MKKFKKNIIGFINKFLTENNRAKILRKFGLKAGSGVRVRSKCFFDKIRNIELKDNCFVNRGCQFHTGPATGKITIGENTCLAMNVTMVCISHKIGGSEKRAGEHEYLDINIGNGCWICANALILPGVTIGDGCVVAAGSVVTSDCEPNCLYAGVPAKKIKEL